MRTLTANVWVQGVPYSTGMVEGEDIPVDVAACIGDHCWASDGESVPGRESEVSPAPGPAPTVDISLSVEPDKSVFVEEPGEVDSPAPVDPEPAGDAATSGEASAESPPRAGRGSSRDAWAEHAEALGVTFPADASRDDIIAAVDAHNDRGE